MHRRVMFTCAHVRGHIIHNSKLKKMGLRDNPLMPFVVFGVIASALVAFWDVSFTINHFGGFDVAQFAGIGLLVFLILGYMISDVRMGDMETYQFIAFWIPPIAYLAIDRIQEVQSIYMEFQAIAGLALLIISVIAAFVVIE